MTMNGCPIWKNLHIQWKRPAEIKYPNIWHRFETKSRCGQSYKIRIEDLTEDRFDEAVEFMTKYFFPEEPICEAIKLINDGPALKIYQEILRQAMAQRVSIIAVIDEDSTKSPIVGLHCLFVETKGDRTFYHEVENETIKKMWDLFDKIEKNFDPFQVVSSNNYLQDWGLCTSPAFRGMGIASNILRTLTHMAQTFGLKVCVFYFTKSSSQKVAEKAGFKVGAEIAYDDYKDDKGEVIIPVLDTEKIKFMYKKF